MSILKSFSPVIIDSNLIEDVGIEIAYFYWFLCDISTKRADSEGWFYVTMAEIEEGINYKRTKQEKSVLTLKQKGYIDSVNKGLPLKKYFRIKRG